MPQNNTMPRDANNIPFENIDSFGVVTTSIGQFTGGTAGSRGDDAGALDPFTLFTVTGDVLVRIFGVCTTTLVSAGGGTLSVGATSNTAALIAITTGTAILVNNIWIDATPSERIDTLANVPGPFVVVNGSDILESVGTADITAGSIYYICLWRPLSRDGNVVTP